MIEADQWENCYDKGWQGEVSLDAFAHPAKFSRALIRRIYEHAFAEGWLKAGDICLDPFAGVAQGALDALWNGLSWVGVELEPKFYQIGGEGWQCPGTLGEPRYVVFKPEKPDPNKKLGWPICDACIKAWKLWEHRPKHHAVGNLERWRLKYRLGSARIIQGDSRKLAEVIAGADCCIGSPPFADSLESKDKKFQAVARPGRTIQNADYGSSSGQLGAMKEGDFDCVVGSPPFTAQMNSGGSGSTNFIHNLAIQTGRDPNSPSCRVLNQSKQWPESEGQLASLPEGRFEAVIGSPPWETSMVESGDPNYSPKFHGSQKDYGNEANNIGNQSGDTFWSAAAVILAQCYAVLRPGGHCIWVTKNFIRKGKVVPFSDQWQTLCESVGFRLVCRHRAMLVKIHGEQETMFNGREQIRTERKSFFRRLAEKKGSPAIDWEDVICLMRI